LKLKSPLSRVRDWNRKRKQKGKEKEEEKKRTPEPEKPMEPVEEKTEESAPEPTTQEAEEPVPEPAPEESEEPAPEIPTEKTEELTPEPTAEEGEELAPELGAEETEELAPEQPIAEEMEKPTRKPRKLGGLGWFKKREQKEKERAPDPEFFKLLIFPLTLASMLLGLSILPLFPQPLPAVLAFLIAFLTYKKARLGMPIGGLTVGLGLLYNLSTMNFISMLGEPWVRGAVVFVFLFLFTALPVIFHSRRAVISINLGIIAAILLFFPQTYFLAIPLIFTAVVLFKKISFLTAVYYLLLSVPLQVMQYLNVVLPIERWDWWVEPGTSPPVFVPLTEIFTEVQESMLQFRLYDTSKVVYSISDQITGEPPVMPHTVLEMISHYFDSLPGIILFLFMVLGIVSAFVFLARTFLEKSNISHGERLLPTMSGTVAVALFFVLASSLQGPLAFRVDINGVQIAIAIFATLIFTLPTFLIDYTPKKRATADMIMEKVKELKTKLQFFEDDLYEVKSSLPIFYGPFEVKMLMVKDKLNDVLNKTSTRLSEASEIDKIFSELDSISQAIDTLSSELEVSLEEYQILLNCEYSKWRGQFKDMGLETKITAKTDFQRGIPLKMRIDSINEVLEGSRVFTIDILQVTEQVYDTIRSLYDPSLPKENQSIAFAKQKLDEKAEPWIAIDALFTALNNWRKQYSVKISKSMKDLRQSLTIIANLSNQSEKLLPVLGDEFPKMMENAKKAEEVQASMGKTALNVIDVLVIRDALQYSLDIAKDVLSFLYEELKSKEKTIEGLLPTEDYLWEKNVALREHMTSTVEMILNSSSYGLHQVLENLPKSLSYLDECIDTIVLYNEKIELLLNYPVAEVTIEDLFRQKKCISAQNLPFEPKHAEEFLRLFYSKRYRNFSFDTANMLLMKKT
jgi:hypothetical protein